MSGGPFSSFSDSMTEPTASFVTRVNLFIWFDPEIPRRFRNHVPKNIKPLFDPKCAHLKPSPQRKFRSCFERTLKYCD